MGQVIIALLVSFATCCQLFHPFSPGSLFPASSKLNSGVSESLRAQRSKIEEICRRSGVAGASIAVIHHGETVLLDNIGYRDVANKEPMTSDTILPVASLSKSFTACCIHSLRSQSKLSLDDPIYQHLPEARHHDASLVSEITIADLLGHRTGLQKADSMWLGSDGVVLLDREHTVKAFNQLRPQSRIRSRYLYNNICYSVLGEIITKVSGQDYYEYLRETILDPLHMTRTILRNNENLPHGTSNAYSTLDDGHVQQVPLPGFNASTAMRPAGGLLTSVNDMTKYLKAIMRQWTARSGIAADIFEFSHQTKNDNVVGDPGWLFSPLQIMDTPSLREKSYASGWARSQLPTTVGDIGTNPGLVPSMPLLGEGIPSRLAIWHQGSLVGATSFVMILPETQSAVLVFTNTMALNDAADWIGQLLVETLLDSPIQHDFVQLASTSADRALEKYAKVTEDVEKGKDSTGPPQALEAYSGSYVGFGGIFSITIEVNGGGLDILFQGLASQRFRLHHHHANSFTWFTTWNEQIRRARFIEMSAAYYFIHFKARDDGTVVGLEWAFDSRAPDSKAFQKV